MKILTMVLLALVVMGSISCSEAPRCTYRAEFDAEANAGCLVLHQGRLLIVEDYLGQMSLPGGTKVSGEAPQCTAEREVWEETGIRVAAGRKIKTFENGFQVFACEVIGEQLLDGSTRPAFSEIESLHWLGVNQLDNVSWRFPSQLDLMKFHLENNATQISK